jgi:mannose-6-phosphate isomerase-like protein (cupin superfamily)
MRKLLPVLALSLCTVIGYSLASTSADISPATQPIEAKVVNTLQHNMTGATRPPWSNVTGAGTLKAINSSHFDRHYHDCNEYWMIVHGKAKVWCDGKTFYIHDGDIFCIPAQKEHDVLEIYEHIDGFYLEDELPLGGKSGHLHKTNEDAKGHAVPALPIPADFPKD